MFEWTQDLSVGIDAIDNQHKELIKRMDNLLEGINQDKGKQELYMMLKFMEDYGRIHFALEERLMLQHDYPGYKAHKSAHTKFIDTVGGLKNEFESVGAGLSLVLRVQSKTIDWLADHIAMVDKRLGSYLKNKNKNEKYYQDDDVISPIKSEKENVASLTAIKNDVTEKERTTARKQDSIYYDEMTGLFNRQRFMELVSEWISRNASVGRGEGARVASLIFIDIDEFRFINDTYGHGIGDIFLTKAAEILQDTIRDMEVSPMERTAKEGIITRLGGDEFAMFLPYLGAKEGFEVAEQVRKRFKDLHPVPGAFIRSTVSISIAVYPEHGSMVKELFARADVAMYRAKNSGRNKCYLYQPEDRDLEKMSLRLKERDIIQKAIKENRFEPWYQPILDLKDGRIHHYEALARIRENNGNILPPSEFIETAERFGMIGDIDRIIIEKVMKCEAEAGRGGLSFCFGVNLSGKDLGDKELFSFLKSKILETKANPDHLIFEITETAAIGDLKVAVKFIKALKEMGCHFSLDDFGVGFTSFVYLREMEVDYIKIDGFFIRRLGENQHDQLFVKAIADVAKGMGIKTIAEFVEKEETIKLLKEYGVDYAQGYAIGKPIPWSDLQF